MLLDLITVTAKQAANRHNLGVRGRQRGCARLAREFLRHSYGSGCPYVIRNSLAETLAFYSHELRDSGAKIESQDEKWVDEKLAADEEPGADTQRKRELPPDGVPPILGNERPSGPDDDGGGGNLIFFHFTAE